MDNPFFEYAIDILYDYILYTFVYFDHKTK